MPGSYSGSGVPGVAKSLPTVRNFIRQRATSGAYFLIAAAGALIITGSSASIQAHRVLSASAGGLKITGTSASLRVGRKLPAAVGGLKINGASASFRAGRKLLAAVGSEKITGSAAQLRAGRKVSAGVGSEKITGAAASLRTSRALLSGVGSEKITGVSASLRAGRVLGAAVGAEQFNGLAADLVYTPKVAPVLVANPGVCLLTGSPVAFTYTAIVPPPEPEGHLWGTPNPGRLIRQFGLVYSMTADAGVHSLSGASADLVVTRRLGLDEEALLLAMLL